MSSKIYLAPAAGGKSSTVLQLARETARELQAEVRVCVPTGLQAGAWKRQLAAAGGAIGVHILTFDGLVAAVLDAAGQAYTELSEPVEYRLLRTIISHLPLEHYAPLKSKPGFIQVARQVIGELKTGLIEPEQFRLAVLDLGGEARLTELADIYAAYQAQLQNEGWADRVGLHWLAVEALQERALDCCADWPLLIVDGFDDFSPSQLQLLALLAQRVDDLVVTLPQAAQIDFPRYRDTRWELEHILGITAEPLPGANSSKNHPALQHLARHIFTLDPARSQPAADGVTLREAADRPAEARTALRWLKQRIVEDGFAARDVALLARDITPYRPFIRQIAAEFGLPLHLVDGLPLRQSPVIAALLALLRLFLPTAPGGEPNLPRRQVIAAWRSPYFSWQEGDLRVTGSDADRLDSFARDQRVIGGLSQWQAAFAAGISAREQEPIEEEEGERQAVPGSAVQDLQDKFNAFMAITQPPQASTMRQFVAWLEQLIGPDPGDPSTEPPDSPPAARHSSLHITRQARANAATAPNDIAALTTLKEILRGLVWAEEALPDSPPVDIVTFFNELSGAAAAAQFTLPARAGQGEILVANSPQVRGLSFAAVAVMGMSEGSFPATISEDPFLRDVDRQKLSAQFKLPLEPSTTSVEREYFYEAITRPRRQLLLTRPILAENGAEWVASPFWEAAQELLEITVEKAAGEGLLPLAHTASAVEWWETLAATQETLPAPTDQQAWIWQRINTAAHIWHEREITGPSPWNGALDSLAVDLSERYGPQRIWSATRLEAYQTCGFLFFTQNVLKLAPRPEPAEGLDTRQLGSLYHRIFERVTRVAGVDMADAEGLQKTVTAAAQPILDAAPAEEGFRETPWWAHTRQEIIANVVTSLLLLAADDYEFYLAERRFGIDEPALTIPDGDDQLQLRGFIDRIDRRADGKLRIVDYKLGGPYVYTKRAFNEGKKLQLPLYALAAQEALQLGAVAEGFYWHFRHAEPSSYKLTKADGGVEGAIDTGTRHAWSAVRQIRAGQFSPEPPAGGCPNYCPAAAFCWQYTPRAF